MNDEPAKKRTLAPPSDLERIRVADLIAHDRAWLNDDPCPVPACIRCEPENR